MSIFSARAKPEAVLVVGGVPRADLLPPEIKASERARAQRRGLVVIVVIIVLVVAAGYAGASFVAQKSADALTAANLETTAILQQQAQYAEVQKANSAILTTKAARAQAFATEIDWKTEIAAIVATLPSGSQLSALGVTSSTPTTPLDAPSSPLEGARVAEVQLTVTSSGIPDSAKWIRDLSSLKGFVDATPTSIATSNDAGATATEITTVVTLHLNSDVYWNRFAPKATK
jgi:type II secretory pathway pseudopilin PulG